MTSLPLLLLLAASPVEPAPPPPPSLLNSVYWRATLGLGAVPFVSGPHLDLTLDFGSHTFGGAFSTGISTSFATAVHGRWFVLTEGVFVQLDLVYLAATCLWLRKPPEQPLPFHLEVGARVGLGISESFPSQDQAPFAATYLLVRPELRTFVDLEIPFGPTGRQAVVFRAAVDTPINPGVAFTNPFRWEFSVGIIWGAEQ